MFTLAVTWNVRSPFETVPASAVSIAPSTGLTNATLGVPGGLALLQAANPKASASTKSSFEVRVMINSPFLRRACDRDETTVL